MSRVEDARTSSERIRRQQRPQQTRKRMTRLHARAPSSNASCVAALRELLLLQKTTQQCV